MKIILLIILLVFTLIEAETDIDFSNITIISDEVYSIGREERHGLKLAEEELHLMITENCINSTSIMGNLNMTEEKMDKFDECNSMMPFHKV